MNINKLKKYLALVLVGAIPILVFFSMQLILPEPNNFLYWIGSSVISLIIMLFVADNLLQHPFSSMIYGDGFAMLTTDSTGIVQPFIGKVNPPYLFARIRDKNVRTVYDRALSTYMESPREGEMAEIGQYIVFAFPKDQIAKYKYRMEQFTTFLFNRQIGKFISKEFLSTKELEFMKNQELAYANRQAEDLREYFERFESFIIKLLKKLGPVLNNPLLIIALVVVVLIVIGALYGPQIIQYLQGGVAAAAKATTGGNGIVLRS